MRLARGGASRSVADSSAAHSATGSNTGASIALCALVLLGVFGSILIWGSPDPDGALEAADPAVHLLGMVSAGVSILLMLGVTLRLGTLANELVRAVPMILGANLLFPVLLDGIPQWSLPPAGMILAVYAYTFMVGAAWKTFGPGRTLAFATVLASLCYLVFALALQWQVQVWPTFVI
jgi:hypothetical protein